jgi:hypothetical protein
VKRLLFLPNQEAILSQVAQPRKGLFEKTVDEFRSPEPPVAVGWAVDRVVARRDGDRISRRPENDPRISRNLALDPQKNPAPRDQSRAGGVVELTFDTGTPPWNGDLGAFIREHVIAETRHARIRVTGSGPHRFTPVRLPRGLWLEIRVEPLAEAEPPYWLPQSQATGSALIELQGGALVLSNLILQHE